MKIEVKRDICIGAAPCVAIAGAVFQLDEEGKAYVVDPKGADEATIKMAAEACPVRAIYLYDDDGKQIYPPSTNN
jgi:ferredoxin